MKTFIELNIDALLLGFILDALLGDPAWLYHPVCAIGKYISFAERIIRKRFHNLRRGAPWLTLSTVLLSMLCALAFTLLCSLGGRIVLLIGMSLLNWLGFAARSMVSEALGVKRQLSNGIEAARKQVSRIVGRDTQNLTRDEIIRAAVETTAENTTDGVVSPLLYALLGGPVLLWGFKAASTLDSMVGYLDEKYRDIGWSSARLDDVLNWAPARLTAMLMVCASFFTGLDAGNAFRIVRRDRANHLSPNCAWSEAAAAGALHIRLGGSHTYFGKTVDKPYIGDDDRPPQESDISKTCALLYVSSAVLLLLIFIPRLVIACA